LEILIPTIVNIMKLYFINRNPNQDDQYELHIASCNQLPNIFNRRCIGDYSTNQEALQETKKKYPKVIYCSYCLSIPEKPQKPIPFYKRWFHKK